MSMETELPPLVRALRHELAELRGKWLWFIVLGIALVVVGAMAVGAPQIASLATASILGAILLVSGVFRLVGAFWTRSWSGFFLVLLSGLLSLVLALVFLRTPVEAISAIALLVAGALLVGGVFRIVAAVSYRLPGWVWFLLGGVLNLVLGFLILRSWPESSLALIGLFVGLEMIFDGWTWIMLGAGLRSLPAPPA